MSGLKPFPTLFFFASSGVQVIILVGFPGSGKSHFSRHHSSQSKYQVVNRDTLGTWQKCVAAVLSALAKGHSVIVDNTNLDPDSRLRVVSLAKDRGLPVRCFLMKCSSAHAQHNNKVTGTAGIFHSASETCCCGIKCTFEGRSRTLAFAIY